MLRLLGLGAALALAANAIMIPPTVSVDSINTDSNISPFGLVDPFNNILRLELPKCFGEEQQGAKCSILLNFTTALHKGVLELDEYQLYPLVANIEDLKSGKFGHATVTQVPSDQSLASVLAHPDDGSFKTLQITSYIFGVGPVKTVSAGSDEIISATLGINSLEQESLDLPSMNIKLLRNKDGELMILSIDTTAKESPAGPDKTCNDWSVICKLRGMMHGMKSGLRKGCHKMGMHPHGMRPHGMRPHGPPHNLHHGPHSHHDGAGGHRFHHHGHHGHGFGSVVFRGIALLFAGIMLSLAMYLVGMTLGCFIAMFWIYVVRRGRRGNYSRVAQEEGEAKEERSSLDVNEEGQAPPVYEEAPEYVEVVDEKEVAH